MLRRTLCALSIGLATLAALAAGSTALQLQTGRLYGKVVDPNGALVSGATVTVSADKKRLVQTTNAQGEFTVQGLPPGTYPIKIELKGFPTIDYPDISIDAGRTTTVEITVHTAAESAVPPNVNASVLVAQGLETTTFDTLYGKVVVNLPDDIAAGDTISGTVVTEPKGSTEQQKSNNQDQLSGFVIDLESLKVPVRQPSFVWVVPSPDSRVPVHYPLRIVDASGKQVGAAAVTPGPGARESSAPPKGASFTLPTAGQQGRPAVIRGPFDGKSDTTRITLNGKEAKTLAESPRKCVFRSPVDATGVADLTLDEQGTVTRGQYRNVGVQLSAPKTSLRKGESTTLTVTVQGLAGIKEDIPLHLVKGGVVTMQEGDVQTITIRPAEIQPDGSFTLTRKISGQETGDFSVTASVVVFDRCLQDDHNGGAVMFSADTGDFLVCSPSTHLAGFGSVTRAADGQVHQLVSAAGDGKVQIQLGAGGRSGTATVETSNPRRTFTITDRNMTNNTCTCK